MIKITINDIMEEVESYFKCKDEIAKIDKDISELYEQITDLYSEISILNTKREKLEKLIKNELYGTNKEVIIIGDEGPAKTKWVDDKEGKFEHIRKYINNNKLKSIDDIYDQILKDCGIKPSAFNKYDIDIKKLYDAPYGEKLDIKDYLIKEDILSDE